MRTGKVQKLADGLNVKVSANGVLQVTLQSQRTQLRGGHTKYFWSRCFVS